MKIPPLEASIAEGELPNGFLRVPISEGTMRVTGMTVREFFLKLMAAIGVRQRQTTVSSKVSACDWDLSRRNGELQSSNRVEPWSGANSICYGVVGRDSMLGALLDGTGCCDNDVDMKYRPSSRRETKHDADEGHFSGFCI